MARMLGKTETDPVAGSMTVEQFFSFLKDTVEAYDSTIPIERKALAEAFVSWRDRWMALDPDNMSDEQISEGYRWPGYMSLLYECFMNWTFTSAARSIEFMNKFDLKPAKLLVYADGFGASSAVFATALPQTQVVAHIMGDQQLSIACRIQDRVQLPNLEIRSDTGPGDHDAIAAFESFEHFKDPIAAARPVLEPAALLFYTAPWNVSAHGHFMTYGGVPRDKYSRVFGKFLKEQGWKSSNQVFKFAFFNGYPRVHVKQS